MVRVQWTQWAILMGIEKSIQLKKQTKKQTNQVWPIEACMRNDEYRFIHIELLPNLNY